MTAPHEIVALGWHPAPDSAPLANWTEATQRDPLRLIVGTDHRTPPLRLVLANGQHVLARPLPEDRRWRMHDAAAHRGVDAPREVEGRSGSVRLADGRTSEGDLSSFYWGGAGQSTIVAWRPAR